MKGFILAEAAVTAYSQKAAHKRITEKQKVPAGKEAKVSHSSVEKNVSSTHAPLRVLELRVPKNPKSLSKGKLGHKVLEIYGILTISEDGDCHLTEAQENELLKWYVDLQRVYIERFCTHARDIDKAISVLNLLVDEHGNIVEREVDPTPINVKACSLYASEIRKKVNTKPVVVSESYSTTGADIVSEKLDQVHRERVCTRIIKGGGRSAADYGTF